ncbi:MAG: cytochrome c biogenesis protein CcsA [Planctomycetales bacterium]
MASSSVPRFDLTESEPSRGEIMSLAPEIRRLLLPLASLRFTVVLFALAIFLVFAGTMAQTQHDIWFVVHHYFRTGLAWIDLQVFFPKSFFPDLPPVPGSFPFPGGWLIGAAMALNLLAAHTVRFTHNAKGERLLGGLGVIGLGVLVTWLVIGGHSSGGEQGVPFFDWSTLWEICKLSLLALSAAGFWVGARLAADRKLERNTLFGLAGGLATFTGWLYVKGDAAALGDSSMRILWQLIQGGLAGGILLAGCWLVFRKRAGIVLLHGGIGLMMLSELMVGTSAIEGQMHIREGDSVNFVQDTREVELAIIDRSDAETDQVISIPQSRLDEGTRYLEHASLPRWAIELFPVSLRPALGCTQRESVIVDPQLPFDVRVVRYLQNADLGMVEAGDDNPATTGLGREMFAKPVQAGVGAGASSKIDESAAYVEFLKKGSNESLGVYLLSLVQDRMQHSRERSGMSPEEIRAATGPFVLKLCAPVTVELDGRSWEVALRFKRMYRPYAMKLVDVRTQYYPGTKTPRDYSSTLQLIDPTRDVDRQVRVWMNNPLRYAGETFYQSSVGPDPVTGAETTGLQVVTNTGWMIPYVSCMIVAVGLLFQFGQTLIRFLDRRAAGAGLPVLGSTSVVGERWFPALIVALSAGLVAYSASPPEETADGYDLAAAGRLPIMDGGRVKPLDTLARNTLQIISNKETFVGTMDPVNLKKKWPGIEKKLKRRWKVLANEDLADFSGKPSQMDKLAALIARKSGDDQEDVADYLFKVTSSGQPAIRWLLDVVSGRPAAEGHRVFRIENFEVLDLLKLKRREGFLYSLAELREQSEKLNEEVDKVRKKPVESLKVYDRKLLDLDRRVRSFTAIDASFKRLDLPAEPTAEMRQMARSRKGELRAQLIGAERRLMDKGQPPLVVPVRSPPGSDATHAWRPYVSASTMDYFEVRVLELRQADPAVAGWDALLTAFHQGESREFNRAVRKYQELMAVELPPELDPSRVRFEEFFNRFSPFHLAWMLYILAFVLSALAWLGWNRPMNRAAFWLNLFTLALHTLALASRIYISGRPPVTNLYSSAVFIGWGCVVLGLVLELVFRLGIGNVISAMTGFAALFISFKLAGDGDTFTVLQAVLDTQFWLATHVTCITLGYATTFLSGFLGLVYFFRGVVLALTRRSKGPVVEMHTGEGKSLARMVYGTMCFALFFSFVGTVLGGLWADDSWGRFWGWDPKENGALIIVLWNALVLHARWDGMVREGGLALLAIGGNIVTAWSWFGVNELGVGLHSYGFTEGVLMNLLIFVGSQLFLMAVFSVILRAEKKSAARLA